VTKPARCSYNRHCGEEIIGNGPDGQPYCFDHLGEALAEAEADSERDEHGRKVSVMRHGRAF
jgi:hypothetical protein